MLGYEDILLLNRNLVVSYGTSHDFGLRGGLYEQLSAGSIITLRQGTNYEVIITPFGETHDPESAGILAWFWKLPSLFKRYHLQSGQARMPALPGGAKANYFADFATFSVSNHMEREESRILAVAANEVPPRANLDARS
jgi:hypothetical protein